MPMSRLGNFGHDLNCGMAVIGGGNAVISTAISARREARGREEGAEALVIVNANSA